MVNPTPLEKALLKRDNIRSIVALIKRKTDADAFATWQLSSVQKEHELLDRQSNRLFELQDDLLPLAVADATDHTSRESMMSTMEEIGMEIAVLEDRLASHPRRLAALNPLPPQVRPTVKLPEISLPQFKGGSDNWLHFRDSFLTNINARQDISAVEKMQYLNSCLKDEAALLVSNLAISNTNYPLAWDIIMKRYDCKDMLVTSELKKLFGQPKMQSESSSALRKLIDTTSGCIDTLKTLQDPEEAWDTALIFTVTERLNTNSRHLYEMQQDSTVEPKFEDLMKFLNKRAKTLSITEPVKKPANHQDSRNSFNPKQQSGKKSAVNTHLTGTLVSCNICNKEHKTYKCDQFEGITISDRKKLIVSKGCCINCLGGKHAVKDCKSRFGCQKCKARHNTILHEDDPKKDEAPSSTQDQKTCALTIPIKSHSEILLATALVKIKNDTGNFSIVRALIDQGSEATFISEHCARELKLSRTPVNVAVSGLQGSSVGTVKFQSRLIIQSCTSKFSAKIDAYILPGKLTKPLPTRTLSFTAWPHIQGLKLADPQFHISSPIDLLIGADLYADVLRCSGNDRIRDGPPDAPIAQNSVFGWLLTGRLPSASRQAVTVSSNLTFTVDETLQKFWELEQVPTVTPRTEEEKDVELHFAKTHVRLPDGSHQVRLPFKKNSSPLGSSREAAVQRFMHLEKKMMKNPEFRKFYTDFMKEYETLGHMKESTQFNLAASEHCYLPHHGVLKMDSTTTKLRSVFDGSAKTSTGTSLNDNLMVGLTIQNSLLTIIMNFRVHAVAFTADVTKMYRIVKMHPDDCLYLRIVWRADPSKPLKDYDLLTVTYGTSCASYQATKSLQSFTPEEETQFPTAAEIVRTDFYVDDLHTGAENSEAAIQSKDNIVELLKMGCFHLRKFSSNNSAFMNTIPKEDRGSQGPLCIDSDDSVKTLGLQWHPATDEFAFKVIMPERQACATKRTVLSDTSRLFDPTGVVSPTTVLAKLLLQTLWKLELSWDDPLPETLQADWSTYQQQLPELEKIRFPRCIFPPGSSHFQLHGFADASSIAYAAVVYIRSMNSDGSVNVHLLTAKTKVAPIKMTSVPRLELCAALTVSQLMAYVIKSMRVTFEEVHAWTDSTITLDWIANAHIKQEIFVANRVTKIHENLPSHHWHHVRSEDNPADCASRGILLTELINHPLWWHGPSWLKQEPFPINEPRLHLQTQDDANPTVLTLLVSTDPSPILKCTTLPMLLRSTAYWIRYLHNLKNPEAKIPTNKVITAVERKHALHHWIKMVQLEFFPTEIHALKNGRVVNLKSRIHSLNPFLDATELLRVGGRLRKSQLSEDQKHPILLPRNSALTKLIVVNEHYVLLHAAPQLLLANLHQRFWIVNGRDLIRQCIKRCIVCTRFQGRTAQQMMSDLPAARVTPCEPFKKCGVDYAGPFQLRVMKGRSKLIFKGYVVVFVCFVTRAIHLELAGDMSTDTFLGSLRRFIARRGKCTDMYSDCGTNFVGATKELKDFLHFTNQLEKDPAVERSMGSIGVSWHFNPPGAPHMGGLWEAGVKSMKYHLKRVVGESKLTYEEMSTVLTQVEACLNSRPLAPLSTDPNDLEALTPGHFLIGRALTALPEPDLDHLPVNRLSRWQHTQPFFQQLWRRWSSEYVPRLQRRTKWAEPQINLEVGNLVLLKDECLPPLRWKLARVMELHPGDDQRVRIVTLKIGSTLFKRPIHKLVPLPIDSHETPKN